MSGSLYDLQALKDHFYSGATLPIKARHENLASLSRLLDENQKALGDALFNDLHKSPLEIYLTEIGLVLHELAWTKKHLSKWIKPKKVPSPLVIQPSTSWRIPEPLGVTLIIGPWNYPLNLILHPLISALAAGNCAIIKPSEIAAHTSQLLAELLPKYFSKQVVQVVEGGVDVITRLLSEKLDHIFFTGSTKVGRIVALAAANQLIPCTLELGGKSPVIVDASADLAMTARKLVWGKFVNAGQTCIAPDYVYVPEQEQDSLVEEMRKVLAHFMSGPSIKNKDFSRIINQTHFARLQNLKKDGKVAVGGGTNAAELFMEPTVITDVNWNSPIMQEEIFGPLLPVLSYKGSAIDVFKIIAHQPKPLAAYLFASDRNIIDAFTRSTSFGGGCVNDVLLQFANCHLPFGGVGPSGSGSYHGEAGFLAFSHVKSLIKKSSSIDIPLRYPPYSESKLAWLKKVIN